MYAPGILYISRQFKLLNLTLSFKDIFKSFFVIVRSETYEWLKIKDKYRYETKHLQYRRLVLKGLVTIIVQPIPNV